MNDYSRGYFAVQFPMDADPEQVRLAIARIKSAFNLDDDSTATPTTTTPAAEPAPTAPQAQVTPQQVKEAELDNEGMPWDERIHAGTKTKTAKGIWTKRKGVDDATRDAVVAELRQQYPADESADEAPAAAPTAPTVAPPAAAPTISVPGAAPTPYTELVDWLAKNTGDGKKLSKEWVEQQFSENGTSLAALADNNDHAKAFLDAFKGALAQIGG